jgi:gamma-F420-2:alpha-L-glutamate ligase
MRGWILYKAPQADLPQEAFEVRRLVDEAERCGLDVQVFTPEQFDLVVTRDDRKSVLVDGETVALPDFLLPRMGAGTTYFALAVIRHLERLGVHSFNSSASIETVRDKLYSHQILAESNLPVAKTMLAKFPIDADSVEKHIGFPLVLKTLSGSQGQGVFLCEHRRALEDLMELIGATKSSVNIILQEFIHTSHGRDLRVITIGGRAVAAVMRRSTDGSFKANLSRGGIAEEVELTPEIEWLATEVSRLLGLDIAGIDLLFDGEHYRICEANSSPGFEGLEACSDVNLPRQIYTFIAVRLGKMEAMPWASRGAGTVEAANPAVVEPKTLAPQIDATPGHT